MVNDLNIKTISSADISKWILLSKEYNEYVEEIVSDLFEWYDGSKTSISFENYMKAKIIKGEAFIVFLKALITEYNLARISLMSGGETAVEVLPHLD